MRRKGKNTHEKYEKWQITPNHNRFVDIACCFPFFTKPRKFTDFVKLLKEHTHQMKRILECFRFSLKNQLCCLAFNSINITQKYLN